MSYIPTLSRAYLCVRLSCNSTQHENLSTTMKNIFTALLYHMAFTKLNVNIILIPYNISLRDVSEDSDLRPPFFM